MGIISYAQNFEDVLLWRALKNVEHGFYLDIGGHSPDVWSVTRLFYDAGWTGLNVEPHPKFLAQLKARRLHDINLGLAVSDFQGEADFHCIEETGLSALDKTVADGALDRGFSENVIKVPVTTLSEIWDEHVPQGQPVHFLKIDVEGHEERVIRGADWKRHRPWIVVAEATEPLSTTLNHHAWDPLLRDAGYDYVWFDGLNRYYLAHEHAELADAFETPPNIFDNFRMAEVVLLETRLKESAFELERTEAERKIGYAALRELQEKHSRLETCMTNRPRPFWERVLFRSTGKPKKALRKLLFHTNGKPRGVFRKYIIRPDGLPRSALYMWMSSQTYQRLSAAAHFPSEASKSPRPTDLSRRDKEMMTRLLQSRKKFESDTK